MFIVKLHISQIFSDLECPIFKLYTLVMCNLFTKFVKFLEICKQISSDLVTEKGSICRPGPVPRFYDLEVVSLSMAARPEDIDSENRLFEPNLKEYCEGIPNLIYYLKDIKPLNHDCGIFGDKGYIGTELQLDLFETTNIKLEGPYRLGPKDWKPTFLPFVKARKKVETISSQLNDQFLVIGNYAKDTCGLFARIICKVSAITVLQYINYTNNRPIGRIKYALI